VSFFVALTNALEQEAGVGCFQVTRQWPPKPPGGEEPCGWLERGHYHFRTHEAEVEARSGWQYMRKAEGFKGNLKRAVAKDLGDGTTRYTKSGKYIILDKNKKILSFGKETK
jgi:hypothetical protein